MRASSYSHGWSADNTANTFDRNAANSADQRYDTLSTLQVGGTFIWEIAVPNGRYSVRVVARDPNFYNSNYKIRNEEGDAKRRAGRSHYRLRPAAFIH